MQRCLEHKPDGMSIQIIRSNRKSISLEIRPDFQIVVRAPFRMTEAEINQFISDKSKWIETHLEIVRQRKLRQETLFPEKKMTEEEIRALAEEALKRIPERVAYFAPIVGVSYGRITIRNQKTKWGSCSAKGNLNFNCLLMKMPSEVIDYVVVHELCHRKEMNHSKKFWYEVEKVLPDYKECKKWLKENGSCIMSLMVND